MLRKDSIRIDLDLMQRLLQRMVIRNANREEADQISVSQRYTQRFSCATSTLPSRASQPTAVTTIPAGAFTPFSNAVSVDFP